MKVKKIRIENFRNISSLEITPSHINYIVGQNNAGKSSLVAAIQKAICNSTPYGNSLTDLGKKEKEEGSYQGTLVEATVDKLGTITRYIKNSGQQNRLNNCDMPDKSIQEEFKSIFGYDYNVAELMFDGAKFSSMTPKEQKAYLLKLTGISLDENQIIKYMDNPNKEVQQMVKEVFISLFKDSKMSIDDIEQIYKIFFNERRVAKKDLETLTANYNVKKTSVPKEKPRLVEYIDKDIATLSEKSKNCTNTLLVAKERIALKNSTKQSLDMAEQDLENAKVAIIPNVDVSDELLLSLTKELGEIEALLSGDTRELGATIAAKQSFEDLKTKLSTSSCPLYAKLECKTDKTPLYEEFDKQIETCSISIEKLNQSLDINKKCKEEISRKLETIKVQRQAIALKENLEKNLENVKNSYNSIIIPCIDGVEEELALLENSIKELLVEKTNSIAYNKLCEEVFTLKNEVSNCTKKVENLEYLVSEFAPNGVRSRILEKIIMPLQSKASSYLQKLTNEYTLEFEINNDGFSVLVNTKTGKVPLKSLSISEQLRIQIILQHTINSLTGVGLLVIDEIGLLDKTNFEKLALLIDEIAKDYGTIFILGTKEHSDAIDFAMTMSSKNNTKVIWMEAGVPETL